jgi:transmembrane sensor
MKTEVMGTMDPGSARSAKRIARAEAAVWVARLHGADRSPELEEGLRSWLGASPENARQFECVTEVWDGAAGIRAGTVTRMAPPRQRASNAQVWARAAAVAAVCILAALGGYAYVNASVYRTGIGEQRLVRLDDGSRITLNSATRIRLAFSSAERRVNLEEGEALFEVSGNPKRPFSVVAGNRKVVALGTSFVVRRDQRHTAVTLVEGKVAITSPGDSTVLEHEADVVLTPGERATLSGSAAPVVDQPKLDAVTAWRRGEVILDNTPLAVAVAEMNRYQETPLVIGDGATGSLPVSGIYQIGNSEAFASAISRLYGLDLVRREGAIHLSTR